jgi:hypothetical protein
VARQTGIPDGAGLSRAEQLRARQRIPLAGKRGDGRGGDIGIGYSFGASASYQGQRFAARAAGDPLGTLGFHESVLIDSIAAKGSGNRYEDFATTVVDPTDDATFWYMGDYYKSSARSIHIGSFRIP